MDMLCPRCGEPIDNDEFHAIAEEQGSTYREVVRDFQRRGCVAIGSKCSTERVAHPAVMALYEVLGDDTDGAMAMLEDFGIGDL